MITLLANSYKRLFMGNTKNNNDKMLKTSITAATFVIAFAILGQSHPTTRNAEEEYYWSWSHDDEFGCQDAIKSGVALKGYEAYVARIRNGEDIHPGFIEPTRKGEAVAPGRKPGSILSDNLESDIYEVLCGKGVAWQWYNKDIDKTFPENAIQTGQLDGRSLYSCRALISGYMGNYLPGKFDPKDGACYLAKTTTDLLYDFVDKVEDVFEVLTSTTKENNGPAKSYTWEWAGDGFWPCNDTIISAGLEEVTVQLDLIYPARTHHNKALIPGMKNALTNYYTMDSKVYNATNYEVLCGSGIAWISVDTSAESIPSSAIEVGYSDEGTLYLCRQSIGQNHILISVGSVAAKTGKCIIPVLNETNIYEEISTSTNFEILVSV